MNILAAALLIFQFIPSSDPRAPGPVNPYCGKTISNFPPPPIPTCHDGTLDATCVAACKLTYKTGMVTAYDAACNSYNDANTDYIRNIKLALQNYDTCMAGAQSIPEREACRDACAVEIANAVNILNTARNNIVDTLSQATLNATFAFTDCCRACCH